MVLTEEELQNAKEQQSSNRRIKSNLRARLSTCNLLEQTCCDREIQRCLKRNGTPAYQCNCFIIQNAIIFMAMGSTLDHGWGEYGPTDSDLWKTLCETVLSQSTSDEMDDEEDKVLEIQQSVSQMAMGEKENASQETTSIEEGGDASDDEHNLKQRFYNRIMEELCQYSSSSESDSDESSSSDTE